MWQGADGGGGRRSACGGESEPVFVPGTRISAGETNTDIGGALRT